MDRDLIALVDTLERQRPETNAVSDDVGHLLKRRLLGAAVLVALAVIFLPLVLDGSGSESRFRRVEQLRVEPPRIIEGGTRITQTTTPASATPGSTASEPAAPTPPVAAPSVSQPTVPATAPTPASPPIPASPPTPASSTSAPTSASRPATVPVPAIPASNSADSSAVEAEDAALQAWIIQAGSFSDQANAMVVRDQLRNNGHPAFVTLIETGSGAFYRVNVGPLSDRDEAQRVEQRVEQELGNDSIIKRYP